MSCHSITISSGQGEGSTKLAAFDAALWDAGVANYNLIKLSSVIPPNSKLIIGSPGNPRGKKVGERLYVVLAEKREDKAGEEAWAGLGWVQAKNGHGLFVEHNGTSEKEVIKLIKDSLEDMVKYRGNVYGQINYQTAGIKCRDKAVCALVVATYY
ncbi:pyruvoyl-dependent arginine decarboxylase [Patescibacteria group bacterium]|nr:pyruvoyl-dependent arginine decarboxylase [Patescibacteria group bacterium]